MRSRSTRRRKARREADAEANRREEQEWLEQHGSPRPRRAAKEGVYYGGIYRSERLALERPGWVWGDEGSLAEAAFKRPLNPPEEAFKLLDRARTVDPDAQLEW